MPLINYIIILSCLFLMLLFCRLDIYLIKFLFERKRRNIEKINKIMILAPPEYREHLCNMEKMKIRYIFIDVLYVAITLTVLVYISWSLCNL